MVVVKPDVVVISSDEEDVGDGDRNLDEGLESQHHGDARHDAIVISSDDEDNGDGERNIDEGLELEHDGDYSELSGQESDNKEEEDDVEKSNEEEFVDSCDKLRDRSDYFDQGGNDLQELSLYECKSYLRKHGMRVSGTKEECAQRIKEHRRLNDGSFESLYPRSSFSINCTGDACRGDVVLFRQNMYDSQRKIIGRRTVAGRVIKESYGASTQQHTFSIEVLWSKWFKELNPLSILLVKGRNLYRFGTSRQPWKSEAERSKVLREKHERGRVARHKRKLRETEFPSGDTKGTKRRKIFHRGLSQSKHRTPIDNHNDENKNTTAHSLAVQFPNAELEKALPLTCHSDPNPSMYSNHHLQEASLPLSYDVTLLPNNLPPFSFSSYNHYNNEQGPNQALSQQPDLHHHNNKPPTRRSTDGVAKSRFPKSSFSINCTGDARIGDTVLFKQHVYLGETKVKKKRTVAGRIVKVRECGSRGKLKFLIKVLWATHSKHLHRRLTLPVRSHNLYKFGTFRQPRKNEASNSARFKEKHGPVTHKQKLRKTDIASNKNKGAKHQKGSHKGPSSSKQLTQIAKQKSSKRKGAAPAKETKTSHKRKAVQLQKTKVKKSKQTFQEGSKPNPNLNLNPCLSNQNPVSSTTLNPTPNPDPNPILNTCTNPNARTNPNPNKRKNRNRNKCKNQNPNKCKNQNPNKRTNPNPASSTTLNPTPNLDLNQNPNPNLNACTNPNLNACTNQNPNKCTNRNLKKRKNRNLNKLPKPNQHPNPTSSKHPNPSTNPNPNKLTNPNPIKLTNPNLNKSTNRNLNKNTNLNPNKCRNTNPNKRPNPTPNKHPNSNNPSTTNLNACRNPNLNTSPHPNSYIYHDQPQGSLSSLPLNGNVIPNLLPIGLLPNQPPVWFTPTQPPFGFSGYGGQWEPNQVLTQSPGYYGYNQLVVLGLFSLFTNLYARN